MNKNIIQCSKLCKSYHDGNTSVDVLHSIDFEIKTGDRIAIVGPSGSGKSTLLHLLGGLDKPTSGEILIQGKNWLALSEKQRCLIRNVELGFIYQFHHLLPEFTALENVAMPLLIANTSIKNATFQARDILSKVGLSSREEHKPSQLSGGERQRVAIARALVHKPSCVFADEPTGNLDHSTAMHVFDLMLELNIELKTALVIVTHDEKLASRMDATLTLKDGKLQGLD